MSRGHIFVHDPKNSHNACWICGMKKEEHLFFVEHKPVDLKQTNVRSKDKIAGPKKRQKVKLHG